MTNPLEQTDLPLPDKVGHALNRIIIAMRANDWETFGLSDLNPTQGQILMQLGRRKNGHRITAIAEELEVSAATISDSVAALERKGFVKKVKAKDDARVVEVSLTPSGTKLFEKLDTDRSGVAAVVSRLPAPEQIQLYKTLIQMIRELQENGRIPISRMCVTCRYFRPNVHHDTDRPHHCALVDTPFGDRTIRADCPEHEAADAHLIQLNWRSYREGSG